MKRVLLSFATISLLVSFSFPQFDNLPFYKSKYDPGADPSAQLQKAISLASESGKNIFLDVGGEWCVWCHRLDHLFETNDDLARYLVENYVPVKINVSNENMNKEFLSQYPEIGGYPHLFILDSNGKLLRSQGTGSLEEGKGHSHDKVLAFLKEWASKKHVN